MLVNVNTELPRSPSGHNVSSTTVNVNEWRLCVRREQKQDVIPNKLISGKIFDINDITIKVIWYFDILY